MYTSSFHIPNILGVVNGKNETISCSPGQVQLHNSSSELFLRKTYFPCQLMNQLSSLRLFIILPCFSRHLVEWYC
jgi:hypothetical protein